VPTPPQRGTIALFSEKQKALFLTHSDNQAARVHALQSAYRKHLAANPRDDAPSAGQIRSLGLIEGSLEEKDMKPAALLPHVKTN
jgi:NADH dehydrogenase (ubiquinone) Fe-S protein 5